MAHPHERESRCSRPPWNCRPGDAKLSLERASTGDRSCWNGSGRYCMPPETGPTFSRYHPNPRKRLGHREARGPHWPLQCWNKSAKGARRCVYGRTGGADSSQGGLRYTSLAWTPARLSRVRGGASGPGADGPSEHSKVMTPARRPAGGRIS